MTSAASPVEALADRLAQFADQVDGWTRDLVAREARGMPDRFTAILGYHLGWRDEQLAELEPSAPAGKHLRPALVLLVCEALTGDPTLGRGSAVAVELVHNFSLVHDDIQDRSPLRRFRPTVWALWGPEQAINVGDALFALAQLALLDGNPPAATSMTRALNRACARLAGGQFLDLDLQGGGTTLTLDRYEEMVAGKTAALFECACTLGALAAGASGEVVTRFAEFGRQLGLAFQEQDDVLGVWGDAAETGKPAAADVAVRKRGLPAALALSEPTPPAWLTRIYTGNEGDLEPEQVGRVIAHFEDLGLRGRAEARVRNRFARASALLAGAGGQGAALTQLGALGDLLLVRRA